MPALCSCPCACASAGMPCPQTRSSMTGTNVRIALLAFVLAVGFTPTAHATPADLIATVRNGHTYAYAVSMAEQRDDANAYTYSNNLYGDYLMSPGSNFVSIYTRAHNNIVRAALTAFAENVEVYEAIGSAMKAPFPVDVTLHPDDAQYLSAPKAYLAIAFVRDCPYAIKVCCHAYWMTANVRSGLALADVPAANLFWDGKQAINDFFANFSAAYLRSQSCSGSVSLGSRVAVDKNGEWRLLSGTSSSALYEFDVTAYTNAGLAGTLPPGTAPLDNNNVPGARELRTMFAGKAVIALGKDPAAVILDAMHGPKRPGDGSGSGGNGNDSSEDSGGGNDSVDAARGSLSSLNFMAKVPAAMLCAAVLVLLVVALAALYWLSYRPLQKELAAYAKQFPEVDFCDEKAASTAAGAGDLECGNGKRHKARATHTSTNNRSAGSRVAESAQAHRYLASSASSNASQSQQSSRSSSPSPAWPHPRGNCTTSTGTISVVSAPKLSPSPLTNSGTACPPQQQHPHVQPWQPQAQLRRSNSGSSSNGSFRGAFPAFPSPPPAQVAMAQQQQGYLLPGQRQLSAGAIPAMTSRAAINAMAQQDGMQGPAIPFEALSRHCSLTNGLARVGSNNSIHGGGSRSSSADGARRVSPALMRGSSFPAPASLPRLPPPPPLQNYALQPLPGAVARALPDSPSFGVAVANRNASRDGSETASLRSSISSTRAFTDDDQAASRSAPPHLPSPSILVKKSSFKRDPAPPSIAAATAAKVSSSATAASSSPVLKSALAAVAKKSDAPTAKILSESPLSTTAAAPRSASGTESKETGEQKGVIKPRENPFKSRESFRKRF